MNHIHPLHVASRPKFSDVSLLLALPFDLECAILDQVAADFVAIGACTLVCRQWASLAQQRLFRSVCIDLERGTGYNHETCNPQELQRFLNFLDSNPHIARFVRTVTVHGGSVPSLAGFIRALVSKAPCLHALVLSFMTLDPEIVAQIPPLDALVPADDGPSPRATIDTLEISWCEFNGARALLDMLRVFSHIRQIRVWSCDARSVVDAPDVLDVRASTVPAIESVVLESMHCESPTLLRAVLSASSLPDGALTAIRLKITRITDLENFLLPCIRGAASHLRKLHLDLDRRLLLVRPGVVHAPWDALVDSLAACTALESMTFVIEGKNQSHVPYTDYLRAVLPAYARLASPPPPAVRALTFKVHEGAGDWGWEDEGVREIIEAVAGEGAGEEQAPAHWKRMDAELAGHRALARCAFVFYNRPGHPSEEDRARIVPVLGGVLPRLQKKGMLKVEMRPPLDRQALLYEI